MPKNKDPELEEKRARRRSANTGVTGGMDLAVDPGGFGGGGGGKMDRSQGYEKSMQTGEVINPSHFNSRLEWQEYYDALPQEFKRNYREMRGANEKARNQYLSFGGDFNKLGIKNVKEEGQAAYRRMGMHNLDKSYSYDWENGVKYNVATSDDNVYMKPIPLTPDDYAEKAEIDRYGATPEGFARRMQDSTRNTLNKWSGTNLANDPNTGKIHRGADGRLQAIGESGQTIYFDDFGNALDASGNQTGINYATGGWGSLAGVGILPGATPTNPGSNTPGGGNFANEVTRRKPGYGGWGTAYGPGTSGSGITIPVGNATPPKPVAPVSITAPPNMSGMGGMASPIMGNASRGKMAAPAAMSAPQPAINPFTAPGSAPANRPTSRPMMGRRQTRPAMGFGGVF